MTTLMQTPYTVGGATHMETAHPIAQNVENSITQPPWVKDFQTLYSNAVSAYEQGRHDASSLFSPAEVEFLASIGATPQEIFDFVEDWVDDGEPDPETVLRLTELRRDYFLREQQGQRSGKIIPLDAFPSREASLGGFVWLPRIIAKAKAKLRGELPPDLMYGCGADRRFLKKVNMEAPEFLRLVYNAKEDDDQIVRVVTRRARGCATSDGHTF